MTILLDGTTGISTPAETVLGNLSYTGTLTGGAGVINLGSGQVYKDASGNVGIGTSSPTAPLHVSSSGTEQLRISGTTATGYTSLNLLGTGYRYAVGVGNASETSLGLANKFYVYDASAGATRMVIDSSGNLLVGTTATAANAKLEVKNNSGLVVYFYNDAGAGVYLGAGATSWTAASDARIKTALVPFENAAEKVCTLRAGTGRYLADEETVSRSFLIAQDVQAVLPEAVNVRDDEIGTLGLQYTDVIPLLVAAIQEQQTLITALTAQTSALEERLTALEAPIV